MNTKPRHEQMHTPRRELYQLIALNSKPGSWTETTAPWITALALELDECKNILWQFDMSREEKAKYVHTTLEIVKLYNYLSDYQLVSNKHGTIVWRHRMTQQIKRVRYMGEHDKIDTMGIQFHFSFLYPESSLLKTLLPFLGVDADYTWIVHKNDRITRKSNVPQDDHNV